MHHLSSASLDALSDEYHRLATAATNTAAHRAYLHAAQLLHRARVQDFKKRTRRPARPQLSTP